MEIETKFKVRSPEAFRANLEAIGARFLSKQLERDTYFESHLPAGPSTIRLRSFGRRGLFTVKSVPEAPAQAGTGLKILQEVEVEVEDAALFERMLEMLGFEVRFKKEKVRETYDWNAARICLDELPHVGFYVEIEGSEEEIRAAAATLGLDMSQASGETYMQIFARYKALRKEPGLELVFGPKA